jgi:hypothetical protein
MTVQMHNVEVKALAQIGLIEMNKVESMSSIDLVCEKVY